MGMNFKKFLLTAIPVTFATAFFACSEKIAGTTETDNALANEESSSSNGGTTEEISMSSAISSSSDGATSLSSSNGVISDSSTSIHVSSSSHFGFSSSSSGIIPPTFNTDSLIFNPPVSGGGYSGGGGGLSGVTDCFDSAMVAKAIENSITLGKFIAGRIEKLKATGLSEEQAGNTAVQELYTALGLDEFFYKQPEQRKYMSNLLNYIFGATVESEFYKNVEHVFTETGSLSKEHYCNYADDSTPTLSRLPATGRTTTAFPGHIIYDYTMYSSKNCKGTIIIPTYLEDMVNAKCYDIPACDSSIIGTVVKASYNNSPEALFTCRYEGWEIANGMETATFEVACDKEGKNIFYGGNPSKSFVCSLDSGWYVAETIDAETFDVPCDKHGKLFTSTSNPTKTYVCRKEHFCRDYGVYPKGPCFDEGWDFANKTDLETANSECDTEGKTYTSPSDANLYYVCHDGKWKEFYNQPCDTDNERIKVKAQNITGYVEYICYNETWRPTYEWHAEYPAEYYFNPEINYGSFRDPRDNHVYHTIDFKGRTWIAENMKYAGFSDSVLATETRCLEDSCINVGRFYSFNVADKVCPEGWSLPDSSDIATLGERQPDTPHLISQLGGTGSSYSAPDTYGLSFILSGQIIDTDMPYSPWQGYTAMFWTNETDPQGSRLVVSIGYYKVEYEGWYQNNPPGEPGLYYDDIFLTIRCLKK